MHRVKWSFCPKEPVNTSLSDLLHSTANVKPHYPPLNGVPDPTFTNGHKAWSPWSTVVCRLTPSPLTFGRPRKALSRTASGTKRKSYGTVFSNLLRSQPEKDPFLVKMNWNAAKIKHRLQPCRSAQQSVIIEFSLALILSGFTTTYLTQDYNRATWPPVGLPPHPSPAVPQGPQSSSDPAWVSHPPLEGVRLARLSSVHRVKRSVCPKEPVNTSLSDLLHSTANVKPHYPPLNGVPDPTFTNGHKAWSPWSTLVCRLTPSPLTFGRPRKALSRTASGTKRKSYGTVFSNLLRSQPEKDPFWWKWTENAAKIKHRLQPCRSAQQSVIIEFSLALILSGFTTTYLTQDYNRATWPPVDSLPTPPRSSPGTSEQLRPCLG